ncbi:hypothetical protein E2C01_091425 [Portunus trituberculatus]|uniref:Uncharacterized protein n=1 Tax=Portunus trituberculatus TaxID=210409 RepID=A0A5B7JP13_PORTR|nr:hypothetical protein [Portunus trituberculatus]
MEEKKKYKNKQQQTLRPLQGCLGNEDEKEEEKEEEKKEKEEEKKEGEKEQIEGRENIGIDR